MRWPWQKTPERLFREESHDREMQRYRRELADAQHLVECEKNELANVMFQLAKERDEYARWKGQCARIKTQVAELEQNGITRAKLEGRIKGLQQSNALLSASFQEASKALIELQSQLAVRSKSR